jgi:hypothetical protein
VLRLSYGLRFGPLVAGPRVQVWRARLHAVDTDVTTTALGAGLQLAYERAFSRFDLRAFALADVQRWSQFVGKQGTRRSTLGGFGLGAALRVPLAGRWFAELTGEPTAWLRPPAAGQPRLRPVLGSELALGVVF